MLSTVHRLREGAAHHPDRVRFQLRDGSTGWVPVTWGQVDRAVREVALGLEALGLPRGGVGAVFAPNRIEWLYAALGLQAAGGVMVPIYPSSTADQAGYILGHAEARVVFVDTAPLLERVLTSGALDGLYRIVLLGDRGDLSAALDAAARNGVALPPAHTLESKVRTLDEVRSAGRSRDVDGRYEGLLDRFDRADRALMLYTSGTTGRPKGVPLTYDNVLSSSEDWVDVLGGAIPEDPVDLFWLPMSHIFGWGEAGLGFELGFTSYLCDPSEVLELVQEVRPSVFMSVPAYWEKLARAALAEPTRQQRIQRLRRDTGGRLAFCLSGGAGLDPEVKQLYLDAEVPIIEGYGLTEASPTLTMNRPGDLRLDSVGKPFPRVELRLAEDGEIQARGPNVFGGYHRDPEATKATFTDDGWLATGDLGRLTEDGFLQIVGRKKEILVTAGGKNIPPANIELLFAGDELIEHLVVYGDGKKYLVAGVWPTPAGRALDPANLRTEVEARVAAANAKLAHHETIKRVHVFAEPLSVEGGHLTPTLKVKRKKVYADFEAAFEGLYR